MVMRGSYRWTQCAWCFWLQSRKVCNIYIVTTRLFAKQVSLMLSGPCARRSGAGDRQPHCRSEFDGLPIAKRGSASDTAGQVYCSLHRPSGFLHSTPISLVDGAVGSEGDRGSQQ